MSFKAAQGTVSIYTITRLIERSREVSKQDFLFRNVLLLWNLTGVWTAAAETPCKFQSDAISINCQSRGFETSENLTLRQNDIETGPRVRLGRKDQMWRLSFANTSWFCSTCWKIVRTLRVRYPRPKRRGLPGRTINPYTYAIHLT